MRRVVWAAPTRGGLFFVHTQKHRRALVAGADAVHTGVRGRAGDTGRSRVKGNGVGPLVDRAAVGVRATGRGSGFPAEAG